MMKADPHSFLAVAPAVKDQVKQAIEQTLVDQTYDAPKVPDWVDRITTQIINYCTSHSEELKYIVSVIVLEKKNGGFHLFSTCFWDQDNDGTITVRWDNKTMHCIVSVFGVTLP